MRSTDFLGRETINFIWGEGWSLGGYAKFSFSENFVIALNISPDWGLFYFSSLLSFCEDHNKECPLKIFEQFSEFGFVKISSQRFTTSLYIWN